MTEGPKDHHEEYVTFVAKDEQAAAEIATDALFMQWVVLGRFEKARHELIEMFPSNVEGLNMERVDGYLAGLDLRPVDVIVVGRDRISEINAAVEQLGIEGRDDNGGIYFVELDLAIVFRDPQLEAQNGPEITESYIVHERAHGSSSFRRIHAEVTGTVMSARAHRLGFVHRVKADDPAYGAFLEEGFAESIRAGYVAKVLGRPQGFADWQKPIVTVTTPEDLQVTLPPVMLSRGRDGGSSVVEASYAGAALLLLQKRIPELETAFLEARRTEEGIAKVERLLNELRPGLYDTFCTDFTNEKDFIHGLKYVIDLLGDNPS
ncbi:MAG TPA: hypothetical protein VM581_00960 [Magnetospirillaceae bacterium]|nr:hypothetical protein [Magnetospirillaceae bacterium]